MTTRRASIVMTTLQHYNSNDERTSQRTNEQTNERTNELTNIERQCVTQSVSPLLSVTHSHSLPHSHSPSLTVTPHVTVAAERTSKHRTSNIEHRTSNVERRTSNVERRTSNVEHRQRRRRRAYQLTCFFLRLLFLSCIRVPVWLCGDILLETNVTRCGKMKSSESCGLGTQITPQEPCGLWVFDVLKWNCKGIVVNTIERAFKQNCYCV